MYVLLEKSFKCIFYPLVRNIRGECTYTNHQRRGSNKDKHYYLAIDLNDMCAAPILMVNPKMSSHVPTGEIIRWWSTKGLMVIKNVQNWTLTLSSMLIYEHYNLFTPKVPNSYIFLVCTKFFNFRHWFAVE